jgi:hypothetical protein
MNIFFLSFDLEENAKFYCDQHVNKILLEIVQMLYTAHWCLVGYVPVGGYKPVNPNHPMVMWVRSSPMNYNLAVAIAQGLSNEFTLRFKKIHKCLSHLGWLRDNPPPLDLFIELKSPKAYYSSCGFPSTVTPIPECMPETYHHPHVLIANIRNYLQEKAKFARWRRS